MPTRGQRRLAQTQKINQTASEMSTRTHFKTEDCRALLSMHERMAALGKVDRSRFRELLHCCFGITDDIMLDLTFRAFDRNNDGVVDDKEFVNGLSLMIRGDLAELTDFCYYIYDMNGDTSLAREELYQCLKGCISPGFGIDADEVDDAERDIVEVVMKKLDTNRDGQITKDDFQSAIRADPLMLQSIGPCLPSPSQVATFLSTVTEDYRAYAGCWIESTIGPEQKGRSRLSSRTNRATVAKGGKDDDAMSRRRSSVAAPKESKRLSIPQGSKVATSKVNNNV